MGLSVLASIAAPLSGQSTSVPLLLTPYADISSERVFVYEGDATVGRVTRSGWAVRVGLRSSRFFGGELWYASSARSPNTIGTAPDLKTVGAWATIALTPRPILGIDASIAVGFAGTRVRGWPDFSGCTPENLCFLEGGPSFTNGTAVSPAAGVRLTWSPSPFRVLWEYHWVLRSDVSGQTLRRRGLGVGLTLPAFGVGAG